MSSTPSSAPHLIDETALLGELGLRLPRQLSCSTHDAARGASAAAAALPGDRVVVKITRPFFPHKTEAGAVRVVPREAGAIEAALRDMALRLDAKEAAVSEWIEHDLSPGGELLLSIRWSDEIGPVITLGLGGTAAEVLSSVAVLAPGIGTNVWTALAGKPFARLITGFRNQTPRIASHELQALLKRCLTFAATRVPHSVSEIEVNPLVPTAHGLYALDVLVAAGHPEAGGAPQRPISKIRNLLEPESIAVMGVSATSLNAGRVIVRNAVAGNPGRAPLAVTIVRPDTASIDGVPCVPGLAALDPVDLLVLSIAAGQVPEVVDEAIRTNKAQSIIVIPGGLGERAGSETLAERVRRSLRDSRALPGGGPVVNGANCLGVCTPRVNTIFLPGEKFLGEEQREVPLAIVSQSGALAVSLITKMAPYWPRYVVSLGNQIDLTAGDYLDYFARGSDVDVLAFYVEGFELLDGRRWLQTAARLTAAGKKVVLYRAGRTSAGRRASSSHTAAIAGDVTVARELCRANGILFAETLEDFSDLIRLSVLLRGRTARGPRLGAMSNAGFEAVAIADAAGAMDLPPLSEATRDAVTSVLRERRLDEIVTVANPLDVNPMLDDASFARVASLIIGEESVDAAVIGCVPLSGALRTLPSEMEAGGSVVNLLTDLWRATEKPWVVVLDAGRAYDATALRLHEAGVPVFRSADRAARLLTVWCGQFVSGQFAS